MIDRKRFAYKCNKKRKCRFNVNCDRCSYSSDKTFAVNGTKEYEFEKVSTSKDGEKIAFVFKATGKTVEWDERRQREMMFLTDGFAYTDDKSMEIHRKEGRLK